MLIYVTAIPDTDDQFRIGRDAGDGGGAVFPEGSSKASPFPDAAERPEGKRETIETPKKPPQPVTIMPKVTLDRDEETNRGKRFLRVSSPRFFYT